MGTDAPTTTAVDFDDPGFVADPYPRLAELRAQDRLLRHEPSGLWLAATHAQASAVLRDRRLGRIWTDRQPVERFDPFNRLHRNQMMENEPPEHTRMRRLVSSAFARGHVERLRPTVQFLADELLEKVPDGAPFDLLAEYAEPLPVAVIAELLGVPASDRGLLRAWSGAIVAMYEYDRTAQTEAAAVRASREFDGYVRALAAERRASPAKDLQSDLLSDLCAGQLSEDEVVASAILLLNAGHEASVNVFGNGIVALLRHSAEQHRVVAGQVPVTTVVEEMIRYDAPLQLFERTAVEPVEICGTAVAAGEKVAVLLGSANRDERVFAAPDRFDAARDPNPHLGFGAGLHFCLGAALARMELEVALSSLLQRAPRLRLAAEPPSRGRFVLRGYASVPVVVERDGCRRDG